MRNPAANNGEEEFIENWEFVFSDLQQRGYTKDQAERPDVLTAARQSRGNTETPSSSRMYNLTSGDQSEEEEALRNLGLLQLREVERTGEERVDNNGARNRTSREISREITSESEQVSETVMFIRIRIMGDPLDPDQKMNPKSAENI